jgi:hypothetical protein
MALSLVANHDTEVNLWQVTKGFPELDAAGHPFNRNEVWKAVASYACKVACLVKTDKKYPLVDDPEKPEGEPSSDEGEEEDADKTVSEGAALSEEDADVTSASPAK